MALERASDGESHELVVAAKSRVRTELLLDGCRNGVFTQALGDLPSVFNRKEAQVTVSLRKDEVVSLTDLAAATTEGELGKSLAFECVGLNGLFPIEGSVCSAGAS